MYQTSIRNKKIKKRLNNVVDNIYNIDTDNEEYAYVIKMLGNCRVNLITNSGNESIGIIRGSLRKFAKRIIIEKGDIVAVSLRCFQDSKVDIVHKYNREQINTLIAEKKLSNILLNSYNNMKYKEDTIESNIIFSKDYDDDDDDLNINKLRKIELSDESDNSNESDINVEDI
tara:strand:- start:6095 stop:6610 length:516 start_codon:yes stop_codon:yes gene_type:complete